MIEQQLQPLNVKPQEGSKQSASEIFMNYSWTKKTGSPMGTRLNSKRETGFEPAALALARRCSTTEPLAHLWCPEPESNQWHVDFQSTALPTELSGRKKYFYEAARDRDRTGTGVTPQDFKSCASANSATRANLALFQPLNYYTKPAEICQQLFSIFFIFPSSKPW